MHPEVVVPRDATRRGPVAGRPTSPGSAEDIFGGCTMTTQARHNAPSDLDGHHRKTYEAIFRHPAAHNLEWHDVRSLLGAPGQRGGRAQRRPRGDAERARGDPARPQTQGCRLGRGAAGDPPLPGPVRRVGDRTAGRHGDGPARRHRPPRGRRSTGACGTAPSRDRSCRTTRTASAVTCGPRTRRPTERGSRSGKASTKPSPRRYGAPTGS